MKMDAGWEALLGRYLSGSMNADDRRLLNERLRVDAQARKDFADVLNVDTTLAVAAVAWREGRSAARRRRARMLSLSMGATMVLALLLVSAWWLGMERGQPFATVTGSVGADLVLQKRLHGEIQELHSGVVELVTRLGVRVVVEAPATFRFESAQLLWLERGRAFAAVPPAGKGFTVLTPAGRFVDQGTEFGVEVATDGSVEVHVYEGQVVALPRGSDGHSLHGGQAMQVSSGGGVAKELPAAQVGKFVNVGKMQALNRGAAAGGTDEKIKGQDASRGQNRTLFGNLGDRGGLVGVLYDFKQDQKGNPLAFDPDHYFPLIKKFADSGFSAPMMRDYFQAPRQMRLSFLAVPVMAADEGPRAFGVQEHVQPTGWMVHYRGTVIPPKSGDWRFVGYFDDALMVYINNEPVLVGSRDDKTWREGAEVRQSFGDTVVLNGRCFAGKWVHLNGPTKIDIIVGERPGAQVGGLLLVQNQQTRYRMRGDGTPILPLFVANKPDQEDLAHMRVFAEANATFDLEWQDVPVFKIEEPPSR